MLIFRTQQRIVRVMFGLWVLMGIGFIASMLHLGTPMRALNSLNRIGSSALSNEIASGSLFFAVGGIGWLLAMAGKLSQGAPAVADCDGSAGRGVCLDDGACIQHH
jgi:anaerobic dimethyl sulfoxide reductase subunit C (anchor subunit)